MWKYHYHLISACLLGFSVFLVTFSAPRRHPPGHLWSSFPFGLFWAVTIHQTVPWIDGLDHLEGHTALTIKAFDPSLFLLFSLWLNNSLESSRWNCYAHGRFVVNARQPWCQPHSHEMKLGDSATVKLYFLSVSILCSLDTSSTS